MLLLAAVSVLSLAVSPAPSPEDASLVVMVARRTAVTPATTKPLIAELARLLDAAGLPQLATPDAAVTQLARVSIKDTATCNGKRACLAELGRQLKARWVVLVSVAAIDQELSIGLELLEVGPEAVVETDSLLLPRKAKLEATQLQTFVEKSKARLHPPPPTPEVTKTDAPIAAQLTPTDVAEVTFPPPPPPERSHVSSFVLGSAGAAALVGGIVLLSVSAASRGPLTAGTPGPDGRIASNLTAIEAAQLNASSSTLFGVGLGALIAGAGLGTAAVLTW